MSLSSFKKSNLFLLKEKQRFHLVDNSQLPIFTAITLFLVVLNIIFYLYPTNKTALTMFEHFCFQITFGQFGLVLGL